jgi:sporulation protein YlmC with PRC-barrel domain
MKDIKRAQDLIGNDVYDRHGDRIGRVDNVYIDDATEQPEWVTVRTGVFSIRENFIPLAGASQGGGGICVSVSKTKVKRSPRVSPDNGHLSNKEGQDLYSHYGIQRGSRGPRGNGPQDRPPRRGAAEHPTMFPSSQESMSRHPAAQSMPTPEEETMPGGIVPDPFDEQPKRGTGQTD